MDRLALKVLWDTLDLKEPKAQLVHKDHKEL
jgi:hypothetical protein